MEWKLHKTSLEEFLQMIRNLEDWNGVPFDYRILNGNMDYWDQLPLNSDKFGQKFFALKLREDREYATDPVSRIPVGNYYIEMYYGKKFRSDEMKVVGVVDTKWHKDGYINDNRIHPVFMYEAMIRANMAKSLDIIEFCDISWVLSRSIHNRLFQMGRQYKKSIKNPALLDQSIQHVFKNSEYFIGNKINYQKKRINAVSWIPMGKTKEGKPKGYSYKYIKGNTDITTFSDALNSDINFDTVGFKEVENYYKPKGAMIQMGHASEESGIKGSIVILNEELQELRGIEEKHRGNYSGILLGEGTRGKSKYIYTFYNQLSKVFPRIKTFYTSDGSSADNLESVKMDDQDNEIFHRHRVYLSENKNEYGKLNPNVFNMLVAYVPGDDGILSLTKEEFKASEDKLALSARMHRADCHLPISEDAANIPVKIKRTITENLTPLHYSVEFEDAIKELEHGTVKIESDMIIGHRVYCEEEGCGTVMSPIKSVMAEEWEYVRAFTGHHHWGCDVCGNTEMKEGEAIRVSDKYQSSTSVNITDINMNLAENVLSINAEIVSPIKIARCISNEGVKGLSLPMKQDFIGFVDGTIVNPYNGNKYELNTLPIDMIIPYGAMKGKMSGISISNIRMLNALTQSDICLDDHFIDDNLKTINEGLKDIQKVNLYYRDYNHETGKFDFMTKEVHIGMVSLDITEIGDEFLKVKNDENEMKVSYMNRLFYNWLEMPELDQAMSDSSLFRIDDEENKKFILELIKIYRNDITGLKKVPRALFDNKKGSIDLVSYLEKDQWRKALDHHPLLKKDGEFANGAYYVDQNGQNLTIFPSRATIMKLVDIMGGQRIRIDGVVKEALGMFLDIYSNAKPSYGKVEIYKNAIYRKLTGKQGALCKAVNYMNYGCSAKVVGCGWLPTGVAIVGNHKVWGMIKHNPEELEFKNADSNRVRKSPYGTIQRDPFIWLFQALNAAELWDIKKANEFFSQKYGERFDDIFPDFSGIMLNTMDMLYLKQEDSDGDLARILIPLDNNAQSELEKLNHKMKNYDMICKADPESSIGKIFSKNESWHFDYMMDEVESSAIIPDEPLSITVSKYFIPQTNDTILKGIKGKGNIGIITVSQWIIQQLCNILYKSGKAIYGPGNKQYVIDKDTRNLIASFYQTVFTQDGCVRSLKGDKDLGNFSIDELANNTEIDVVIGEEIKKVPIREQLREEAEKAGYGDIVDPMIAVLEYWREIAAVQTKNNGRAGSNEDLVSPEAIMIQAYTAVTNGSSFNNKNGTIFDYLNIKESENVFEKTLIKPIIDYLDKK